MPTTRSTNLINKMLKLTVQYVEPFEELPRQTLRTWALAAVKRAHEFVEFDSAELNLRFVGREEARNLNSVYRKKEYVPNILTFDYGVDALDVLRADIIICKDILLKEALDQGKSIKQHACHLVVHGVLHACGFDHMDEESAIEMESLEAEIVQSFGFPHPYI